MTTLLIWLIRLELKNNLGASCLMNRALFTLLIGLDASVFTKNPGYPAFVCLPLRPGNPGMTRCTLESQSYKDPELGKVKTVICHVRPSLHV